MMFVKDIIVKGVGEGVRNGRGKGGLIGKVGEKEGRVRIIGLGLANMERREGSVRLTMEKMR